MGSVPVDERREALHIITLQSERLRNLAQKTGATFIANLLESVLQEARTALIDHGHEPPNRWSTDSRQSNSTVVPLRRLAKPRGMI